MTLLIYFCLLLPVTGCHFLRARFIPQLNSTQQMNNPFACVAFNFVLNRDLYMVSLYTRGKETPRQNAVCKSAVEMSWDLWTFKQMCIKMQNTLSQWYLWSCFSHLVLQQQRVFAQGSLFPRECCALTWFRAALMGRSKGAQLGLPALQGLGPCSKAWVSPKHLVLLEETVHDWKKS